MTREAKIGMLTGLGVIVLIGVLLSEYLGDPKDILAGTPSGTTPANNGPTGPMAELPIGAEFRRQRMDPVSVPGMGQTLAGGNEIASPFATNNGVVPPPAYATDTPVPAPERAAPGPVIGLPVSPISVGPSPADEQVAVGPSTFQLPDNATVAASIKSAATAPAGTIYVILPSDTLTKIAVKFYKSAKPADLQRIISANPAVLKDTNSMLVSGKKLTIPTLAPSAPAPAAPADPRLTSVPLPSSTITQVPAPKPTTAKTYVVQSGDTLEKIAKRIAPNNATAMVDKLKTVNAIRDVHALQVGQVLKLPA